MSLRPEFLSRIDDLYQSFIQFDALQVDRLHKYRNIEPESALYLAMLVRIQGSKSILEIGTSTGYSTLWLAEAAKTTNGRIITLEIDEQRVLQAQKNAHDFKLDDVIDFRIIDAKEFFASARQTFDFILLDAERDVYIDYWKYLPNLMSLTSVLIVDNVISHADQVESFIQLVKQDDRFVSTILNIGAGLLMVVKT